VILIKQIRGVNTGVILIKQIRGEHRGDSDKTNQRSEHRGDSQNHPCVPITPLICFIRISPVFFSDLFYQNHPCVHIRGEQRVVLIKQIRGVIGAHG
jgi:hypothetical protein